jgi:hypothetical protein
MASAKLVPKDLQKSPADCLMVIQQAIRWQMDPFAVAQECSVIQGKLMHSGKLVAAVINARGNLIERLSFTYAGQGATRVITVSGRLASEATPRTVTVAIKDASTNNNVWRTQPDQQLMYHGARVWARRHTPELMLGVWSPEEFNDQGARPPAASAPEIVKPQPADDIMTHSVTSAEPHDPETGEIIEDKPHKLEVPESDDNNDWMAFGRGYVEIIDRATSLDVTDQWAIENRTTLDEMRQEAPKVYARVMDRVAKHRASLVKPEDLISAG